MSSANVIRRATVIIWIGVRVIIVRIVVVRIVGKIIPGIPGIQAAPEAIDKDKEATMVKVGMPPVPVVVPVCIMPRNDVVRHTQAALIRLPCHCRTRTLGSRMIELRQHMRWMAKRRKARSCALKVPSTTYTTHTTEADTTSSNANTTYDLSATIEPNPTLETTPTKG